MTDIVKDVQVALQDAPGIQALVTEGLIGKDNAWVNGWIFAYDIIGKIENTQKCAVVVSYGGGWRAPEEGSQERFPIVVVDIWADPTRHPDNSVKVADAESKAFRVYSEIRKVLHLLERQNIVFNETPIASSEAMYEPDPIQKVTSGNGARFLRSRFSISY